MASKSYYSAKLSHNHVGLWLPALQEAGVISNIIRIYAWKTDHVVTFSSSGNTDFNIGWAVVSKGAV